MGDYRAVMVAKRRNLASTYAALAHQVCAIIATHRLPLPPSNEPLPARRNMR